MSLRLERTISIRRCFNLYVGLIMAISMAGSTAAGQLSGRPASPPASDSQCYAFKLQGDVWIKCEAERQQITDLGDVDTFAAVPSGQALVLMRGRTGRTEVLSLFNESIRRRTLSFGKLTPIYLIPTCGTVLIALIQSPDFPRLSFQDALTDHPLRKAPYTNFRCSSDEKEVVGFLDRDKHVLKMGFPPKAVYRPPDEFAFIHTYDVSPNGKIIAYWSDEGLCLQAGSNGRECVSIATAVEPIAVSDTGNILFGDSYANLNGVYECWHNGWRVSTHRLPGYKDRGGCPAVVLWGSGMKRPVVVEPLGGNPQWISPEAASHLVEIAKRSSGRR